MRGLFLLSAVVLSLGVILAMSGCEGPTGPEGPVGDSGTSECFQCHSENSVLLAIEGQYENSVHNKGLDFERNTPPCSGCHTHEGFLAKLATGDPGIIPNPSTIHCFTCHEPHTSGNFNLRTQAPVTLMLGGAVFDRGHGNLCANCHQARVPSPMVKAAPDSTNITSNRWGPHHSMQANMLVGSGGHEFAGYEYENSPHTVAVVNGCPSCHMAAPFGGQAGGHSMNMTYIYHEEEEELISGCNVEDCHYGAVEDFHYAGAEAQVELLLEDLHSILVARNLIDSEGLPVPGKRSEAEAGAMLNFMFVEGDRSVGIHNTDYTVALLESSLAELGATAPPSEKFMANNEARRFLR